MTKIEKLILPVTAIWLRRDGDDATVLVELGGQWRIAIREGLDGQFSHIAESHGAPNWKPDCLHINTENGFGLAGGGYGPYEYCQDCGTILSKIQDPT